MHYQIEESMTNKELEKGAYAANRSQLDEDKVYFVVPPYKYDIRNDERLLIPIIRNHKIGFVNRQAVSLVEPKYDVFKGNVMSDTDFMIVGRRYSYGYPRSNGEVQIYNRYKWGLLDAKGNEVQECKYANISISDDKALFTLKSYDKGYCVVNRDNNEIVPYGDFDIIDGYTKGYARVKKEKKWGIIDTEGRVVLPIEYDAVWFFHNRPNLNSTKVIYGNKVLRFEFKTGKLFNTYSNKQYREEGYGRHYGEYAGTYAQDVAGYSDDVINDAFDGEPDAYWNID